MHTLFVLIRSIFCKLITYTPAAPTTTFHPWKKKSKSVINYQAYILSMMQFPMHDHSLEEVMIIKNTWQSIDIKPGFWTFELALFETVRVISCTTLVYANTDYLATLDWTELNSFAWLKWWRAFACQQRRPFNTRVGWKDKNGTKMGTKWVVELEAAKWVLE